MLNGSCHCGNVRLDVPTVPRAVLCNCSICRRNGALWAFYPRRRCDWRAIPNTRGYVWGARHRDLPLHRLRLRDAWEPLNARQAAPGVNIRNFDPHEIGDVRLRRFDGAHLGLPRLRARMTA